jgi:hypothetical protein
MKNKIKLSGIITLTVIISFMTAGCPKPDEATVTSVTVSPESATVAKGATQAFTATVTGDNDPEQTVTWSIVQTNKKAGTTIDTNGKLTVATAETLSSLTVKATSTVDTSKSGTAEVTITGTDTGGAAVEFIGFNGENLTSSSSEQVTRKVNGYDYELWNQNKQGTANMTIGNGGGGTFRCNWSGIENVLFRAGKKYGSGNTQTHSQIGTFSIEYNASSYNPVGNSYLSVYGWTLSPLIEYYIVDSWGSWRPPGGTSKGQVTIDGGTYDIYETTRTNQPSIQGTQTFQQYWSVRTSKRTSGTISISQHFKAWADKGMTGIRDGKLYEVAFKVEGYQSSGSAEITKNILSINGVPIK